MGRPAGAAPHNDFRRTYATLSGVLSLVAGQCTTQTGQRTVLEHPNRAGGGPDYLGGFRGAEPDHNAQHQNLALSIGQHGEQPTQPLGLLGLQHPLLGAVVVRRGVVDFGHRLGPVPHGCPESIGHLVGGDAVDERSERQPPELVAGQRCEHGQADVLRHILG